MASKRLLSSPTALRKALPSTLAPSSRRAHHLLAPLATRPPTSRRTTPSPRLPPRQTLRHNHQNPSPFPTSSPSSSSSSDTTPKQHTYTTIHALITSHPTPTTPPYLLDVREPSEYAAGHIPTALNMPLTSAPQALLMPDGEFEEKFGFEKPGTGEEVVFYCKSGVRSAAAARIAVEAGWGEVGEYKGSWNDWCENGGEVEK